jgi:hypothetical protein
VHHREGNIRINDLIRFKIVLRVGLLLGCCIGDWPGPGKGQVMNLWVP